MVLSFVNAPIVWAILDSISCFDPSSVTTEPKYLKLWTVSSFWPPILTSKLIPLMLLVISLVFSALISMPRVVDVVSRWLINLTSSSSFPARASMSSAKRKLVIVLPPMLTEPSWFSKASVMILEEDIKKSRWKQTSLSDSNCCPEPFSYTAIVVYCAGGFAVEALYDFNQVGIDVVSFIVDQRTACHTLSNAFLKSTKNGSGPVGVAGTSCTVFSGWKSVQLYCVLV